MKRKRRLSVSIDGELVEAAERAVADGQAPTLSAWVTEAMRLRQAHDGRLAAMAAFIAGYEAEYGEISAEEMQSVARRAHAR